jgi:methionyl aminopeptidase
MLEMPRAIPVKTAAELDGMRRAGALAYDTLSFALSLAEPGVVTERLDDQVRQYIVDHGAVPATLGYKGYPKSTCISVNEVICHGIPGPWRLSAGDIVCIDVTVILDGFHGDTAATVPVGEVGAAAAELIAVTGEACRLGVAAVAPDARLGDVGHAIQTFVEGRGYSVVRNFVGHGIGRKFHEPPQVRHFGRAGTGPRLRPGMVFTVEPMVNAGDWRCEVRSDGWTAVTLDGSLSAQFEHTVAVTTTGAELLTVPAGAKGWHTPGGARPPAVG